MFQRPYVWTLNDQWEPLWEDVKTLVERVLETSGPSYGVPDTPPHFLGAVVLDQQLVPSPYTTVRHVIDGQQRLTTLQLLLDAAHSIVQTYGAATDASALAMLTMNNSAVTQHADEIFKVWPSNPDRDAFRSVMRDDLKPSAELHGARIVQAYRFFTSEIEGWTEITGDPEKVSLRLHALSVVLMQLLKIVVIDLEPGDNAQVIFETLNHRGTPLLAGDLVKNFVFQVAEVEGVDVERLYWEHWAPFDAEPWRHQVKQGRFYRPRIDVFLNYWLTMRQTHDVPSDQVFSVFREHISHLNMSISEVLEELSASACVFDQLDKWPAFSVEGTFAYRALNVMDQYAFGPLLLWLFGWNEDRLPLDQRELALRSLESWIVRRMLCRMTSKQVNILVIELLRALVNAGPERAGSTVLLFFAGQDAESRIWPTDDDVREALRVQPIYTAITRARLRMVLEAIEDEIRTPLSDEQHCVRGAYTIEHVMPQGWDRYWTLPLENREVMAFEREKVIQRLGNLTLVNDKLNPSLSNRPWTDDQARAAGFGSGKHSLLQQHGTLHLNSRIVAGCPDDWDEDQISTRGDQMAQLILNIWPSANTFVAKAALTQ